MMRFAIKPLRRLAIVKQNSLLSKMASSHVGDNYTKKHGTEISELFDVVIG